MKRKRNMGAALQGSLEAEGKAVRDRFGDKFSNAELVLNQREALSKVENPVSDLVAPRDRKKVVRDTFSLPEGDYEKIARLRERFLTLAKNVNKSEVIRVGLHALEALDDQELLLLVEEKLVKVKPGRPTQIVNTV